MLGSYIYQAMSLDHCFGRKRFHEGRRVRQLVHRERHKLRKKEERNDEREKTASDKKKTI